MPRSRWRRRCGRVFAFAPRLTARGQGTGCRLHPPLVPLVCFALVLRCTRDLRAILARTFKWFQRFSGHVRDSARLYFRCYLQAGAAPHQIVRHGPRICLDCAFSRLLQEITMTALSVSVSIQHRSAHCRPRLAPAATWDRGLRRPTMGSVIEMISVVERNQ
jgi:hypothetical protein